MKYLTPEFISSYENIIPPWGPIGEIVFYRTYSRWLPDKNRRETWTEMVTRVVEYSMTLDKTTSTEELKEEAEGLFDTIWNMRAFPAGRTMWIGGTKHVLDNGLANFNCSHHLIKSVEDYHDLVKILMSGAGGGLGLRSESVEAFKSQGALTAKSRIKFKSYDYIGYPGRAGYSQSTKKRSKKDKSNKKSTLRFKVGDSREDWAVFTRDFLKAYLFENHKTIEIDTNFVRPFGTELKTFGGRASGPKALVDFINAVVSSATGKKEIDDVLLLDIGTAIGRKVVSGGTRRSALIALGDSTSIDFIGAKSIQSQWWNKAGWRSNANNTIVFEDKPTKEQLRECFNSVIQGGEPGICNAQAARKRRYDWKGGNACFEILMRDKNFCNLVSLNLAYLARHGINEAQLLMDVELITRHNLRITNSDIKGIHPDWDKHQKEDRLLGVSFTGYGDYVAVQGEQSALNLLKGLRRLVKNVAYEYADDMGIPHPLLITTVKPEGTVSLLYGASSGLHDPYAPYYIRRVRIAKSDAVAQSLIAMGMEHEVDVTNSNSYVFSFPIKTDTTFQADSKPALEQMQRYFNIMEAWVDHNASNTISISASDIEPVIDMLLENWDKYVGISFLPKSGDMYAQMPFEAIIQEEYEAMIAKHPSLRSFSRVLESIEKEMSGTDDLEGCEVGGICPVR